MNAVKSFGPEGEAVCPGADVSTLGRGSAGALVETNDGSVVSFIASAPPQAAPRLNIFQAAAWLEASAVSYSPQSMRKSAWPNGALTKAQWCGSFEPG
ncbi:hypothetical protein [Ensifer sp. 1H6]|uniref:hypothetical protein n=1 Tax=Ensifer sp. 1H6 TaxID=1911585 RepID=UPI001FDA597C|nr:hypothetical protein [Ensifer sp. 1H6]